MSVLENRVSCVTGDFQGPLLDVADTAETMAMWLAETGRPFTNADVLKMTEPVMAVRQAFLARQQRELDRLAC